MICWFPNFWFAWFPWADCYVPCDRVNFRAVGFSYHPGICLENVSITPA
jgi:hypothetical protein